MYTGDAYAARCDAWERLQSEGERKNNDLHRAARILREAAWEDSYEGHSRRYWSLMMRLQNIMVPLLPFWDIE